MSRLQVVPALAGSTAAILFALECLMGTGASPKPQEPKVPEIPIIMPILDYPDQQEMTQVSGRITAVFRAGGSFTFRSKDQNESVSLNLSFTMQYQLAPDADTAVVTRTVNGTATDLLVSKCTRREETRTYSGSHSTSVSAVPVVWSKERQLAAFIFPNVMGLDFSTGGPLKMHYEMSSQDRCRKERPPDRDSSDGGANFNCIFPAHSTANSKFARYLDANPGAENQGYSWIEASSKTGKTHGQYTLPMFFDGTSWHSEGAYRANGEDPRKPPEAPGTILWPGSVQVIWSLGDKLPEGKMTLEPGNMDDYNKWEPLPADDSQFGSASPVTITANILPKEEGKPAPRGKIEFWLRDVSHEKGKCLNYPANGGDGDDLRFVADQPGLDIDAQNPRHATTKEAVTGYTVSVEALDTGAYGTLQATCEELGLIAEDQRTHLRSISIPMDDNQNHVADEWETGKKNAGGPRDSDEETVAEQEATGDGITLYSEYRGVLVAGKNGREFKRLDPGTKEMFVLDPGRDFPLDIWKRVTQIEAYRLDDDLVEAAANSGRSPLVNFNASDRGAHPFYALKIRKVGGDKDPDPAGSQPKSQAGADFPIMAYAYQPERGIKGAAYVKIFPERACMFLNRKIAWLEAGLANPKSPEGEEVLDPQNQFTAEEAAQALAVLKTSQGYTGVLNRVLNTLFIHEVGHVCGDLPDHDQEAPDDQARQCLMFNRGETGQRRMVVLSALGRGDPDFAFPASGFCRLDHPDYHCFRMLSVKDW